MKTPQMVPIEILHAIATAEAERLGMTLEECVGHMANAAYFPDYSTDSPGHVGPLVVVVWPISPGAVSTFIQKDGRWQHCNSSQW